ncbi:hypothetical protein UFOVP824_36 [uncultured Caudovirales phage]|uniref:Uncharacterized protein n=1 Tax=uncultured Caudovirales phage TaxID=2100421 RepID=A0A6J5P5D7_9CAUD|nr:hypothetical protein UFOVP824_36 [uncultured Caudovirales phage]
MTLNCHYRDSKEKLNDRLQQAWRKTGDALFVMALSEILVQEGIIEEQAKEIERLDKELKAERDESLRLAKRNTSLVIELEGNLE